MKILDNQIIQDKYDVIIIGAGIGGITSAALLANKGLNVLNIEQHYLPGGVCSSVKRHDVAMDAGAALLFGWGNDYRNPHVYVMNALEEDIDIIPHEAIYRMHFKGDRHVTFWKDFDRYFRELVVAFPGTETQLKGFYDECWKIYRLMNKSPMPYSPDAIPDIEGLKMLLKHPISTLKLGKIMDKSLKEIFEKYIKDPEIEGLFDLLIASCYCTVLKETPLMLAAAIVVNTHTDGAYYPAGSPQMLPNKIEKALEKKGGQILYRNLVEEILIKNGKAYGVKLANGLEIYADRIISDATIWNLYGKLIKPEHLSKDKIDWANKFEPSAAAAIAYITVKKEAIPGGTTSIEAFIDDLTVVEKNNYFVYIPSIDDPSICPEDMHSVSILCSPGDYDWPRPWDPRYKSQEYENEKQKLLEDALNVVGKRFPHFRENIVTVDVASPSTTERFTLRNYGIVGGPKQTLGQHLLNRLKSRTDIEGLYAVGDSTVLGEGVTSVTSSALGAANSVLKDLEMPLYLIKKPKRSYVHYVEGKTRLPLPDQDEALNSVNSVRLANECQWCEDTKCMKKCPAGIDIPNFVRRIEAGNIIGAARAIREKNPLGAICGILCPSEKLCEKVCNRFDFSDHSVRIKDLQLYACQEAGKEGWPSFSSSNLDRKIAIIGAGPSGLSCAHYLSRLGFSVDLYEKHDKVGGLITQAIPNYRYNSQVVEEELSEIINSDRIRLFLNQELGKDIELNDLSAQYDGVYLAFGLNHGKILKNLVNGNNNFIDALEFLNQSRMDQTQDLKDLDVLVIGGGSVAIDAAMTAKASGASVSIACLESADEMRCLSEEVEELTYNNIELHNSWGPSAIVEENGQSTLKLIKCKNVCDDEGNFAPEFDDSIQKELKFSKLIFAIGQEIDPTLVDYFSSKFPKSITNGKLNVDSNGFSLVGLQNVYLGGDLLRGGQTIVQAVADGRMAASLMHKKFTE